MSLIQKVKDAFTRHRLPLDKRTVAVSLGEPMALAHTLTVDRLQGILRQAEAGECQELFAVYRDIRIGHAHSQTVINQRKLAVLNKALAIVPEDPKNPADVRAAEAAQALTKIPGWTTTAMNHLLNGHLYPVAVLEQVYGRAPANGLGLIYQPVEWAIVPYHLLDWTDGFLQIWDADARGQRLGTKAPPCPIRYVVHRGHLLTDIPDNWGGPMRAALFWWLFAVMDRDWWVRFLNRFGTPFIVGKYDTSDTTAKRLLMTAFSAASQAFGLVVSRETEIKVESVASASHGEAYKVMQEFANGELSKLFIGQTMTVSAQSGGLGGAQAEIQDNTKGDIEAWDLTALAETVNNAIIGAFLTANGIPGRAVLQVATDTAKELTGKTQLLEVAAKIGLELTDEAIQAISNASGLQFRRAAGGVPSQIVAPGRHPPAAPLALAATLPPSDISALLARLGQPTDAQLHQIADAAAPGLAAAFRGRYAAVADLIAASTDAADLEHRLHLHFTRLPTAQLQPLIEAALVAYAATGAATARVAP